MSNVRLHIRDRYVRFALKVSPLSERSALGVEYARRSNEVPPCALHMTPNVMFTLRRPRVRFRPKTGAGQPMMGPVWRE